MSFYTLSTWLYANMLYPLMLFMYMGGKPDGLLSAVAAYFPFLLFALLLSLPSLLFSSLIMQIITRINTSADIKLIVWFISAQVIVIANYFLISYGLFQANIVGSEFWYIVIPAMIAVALTVLIRIKFFYISLSQFKNKELQLEK